MAMVTGFGQGTSTFASPTKKQTEMSKSTHPSGMNRPNEWVGKTADTFEKQQATPQPVQNPQLQTGAVTPQDPKKARDAGDDTLQKVAQTNLSNLGTFGLAVQGAVNRFTNQGKGTIGSSGGVNVKFDPTTKAWTMEDTLAAEQGTLTSDKQAEQKALGGVLDEWYTGETGKREALGFREGLEREAERLKQHYPDVESKTQYLLGLSDRLAMLEDQGLGNSAEARSIRQSISLEDDKGLVKMLYDARKKYKDVVTGVTGEGQTWSGDGFGEYSALDLESLTKDQIASEMKNAMVGQMGLFAGDYALNVKNQMDQMREEYLNAGSEDLKRQQALQKAAQDWLDSQKDEMEGNKDDIDDAFNDTIDELDNDLQGGGGSGSSKEEKAWTSTFGSDQNPGFGPATPENIANYESRIKTLLDANTETQEKQTGTANEIWYGDKAKEGRKSILITNLVTPLEEWLKDTSKPKPAGVYANVTPEEQRTMIADGATEYDIAYLNNLRLEEYNENVNKYNEYVKVLNKNKDTATKYTDRLNKGEKLTPEEEKEFYAAVGASFGYMKNKPETPLDTRTLSPSDSVMNSRKTYGSLEEEIADRNAPYQSAGVKAVLDKQKAEPVSTNMSEYATDVNKVLRDFYDQKAVGATTAPDPISYYMSMEMYPTLKQQAQGISKYGGSYLTPMGLITAKNADSFLRWQASGYDGEWTDGILIPGMDTPESTIAAFSTPPEALNDMEGYTDAQKADTIKNKAITLFDKLYAANPSIGSPTEPFPGLTLEQTIKAYEDAKTRRDRSIAEEKQRQIDYDAAQAARTPEQVAYDIGYNQRAEAATAAFSSAPSLYDQWLATQAEAANPTPVAAPTPVTITAKPTTAAKPAPAMGNGLAEAFAKPVQSTDKAPLDVPNFTTNLNH